MKRIKLDKIDRKILHNLQAQGRITNVELAKMAGISAPPCMRRVRALEEHGYINGYFAKVNSRMMGYGVTVFAHVKLISQAESDLNKFEQLVTSWPLVREGGLSETPRSRRFSSRRPSPDRRRSRSPAEVVPSAPPGYRRRPAGPRSGCSPGRI